MLGGQAGAARGPGRACVARFVDPHPLSGRNSIHVGGERNNVGRIRVGGVNCEREAEVRGEAVADLGPAQARVVRAVDAAVKL